MSTKNMRGEMFLNAPTTTSSILPCVETMKNIGFCDIDSLHCQALTTMLDCQLPCFSKVNLLDRWVTINNPLASLPRGREIARNEGCPTPTPVSD